MVTTRQPCKERPRGRPRRGRVDSIMMSGTSSVFVKINLVVFRVRVIIEVVQFFTRVVGDEHLKK